ncbi:hypothetical protein B0H13DRAFT_1946056 [Mycena leptocephala]|nr:hypothetical protein B0H13DRAFT_1946056 [Mycena leptocephala]
MCREKKETTQLCKANVKRSANNDNESKYSALKSPRSTPVGWKISSYTLLKTASGCLKPEYLPSGANTAVPAISHLSFMLCSSLRWRSVSMVSNIAVSAARTSHSSSFRLCQISRIVRRYVIHVLGSSESDSCTSTCSRRVCTWDALSSACSSRFSASTRSNWARTQVDLARVKILVTPMTAVLSRSRRIDGHLQWAA